MAVYLGRPVSLESREPCASLETLPWEYSKPVEIPILAVPSALPLEIFDFPIPLAELRHVTTPPPFLPHTRGRKDITILR